MMRVLMVAAAVTVGLGVLLILTGGDRGQARLMLLAGLCCAIVHVLISRSRS